MLREKPKVGQRLYSLNVGNAARHTIQQLSPVYVSRVGRKYFYCLPVGKPFYREVQYYIESWGEKTDYSATSKLYENQEEHADEKEKNELVKFIHHEFDFYIGCPLSLDVLRKIKQLILEDKANNG